MKTVKEIKQRIKWVKSETEYLKNKPKFVENYFYDGYLSALEYVLEDSEDVENY